MSGFFYTMELIKIGKVLKTHGFKGNLKVFIDEFYMNDFEEMNAVFVNNLPYFIHSKDINSDAQAIINLEDIDTKEKASALVGKDIFAKEDDLTEILLGDEYDHLVGYKIIDNALGNIGIIHEIIEMPFQILAKIIKDNREVLIPLNDDFIIKIDESQKQVIMDLPSGLLEM